MLEIEITVIQFTEMGACLHDFHEHIMQLLFLALNCLPQTISTKYLKIGEAWEKIKPIILNYRSTQLAEESNEGKLTSVMAIGWTASIGR